MKTEVRWHERIDSTNEEAKRLAESGEQGPLWIAAHEQTAGRGRRGRVWISRPGNLFASVLLRPARPPDECAQLSFAAALAAGETVAAYVPDARTTLKWPNDVLLDGRKIAGVLLESQRRAQSGPVDWLVAGTGINLVHFPSDAEFPATALSAHVDAPEPEDALGRLAANWTKWYETWMSTGFAPVRDAWLARAEGLGGRIRARLATRELDGRFEGLADDGALLLRGANGLSRISAGEVFFRD
ncbi:MAG: biotin--[acetyl-CoA-carboxylase] ligase [Alphaproteobacteria bacterium]